MTKLLLMGDNIKYDEIINKEMNGITIQYGIIHGESSVIYIKVGNGGDIHGYNNKYLAMAYKMKEKYDYTVIVASNPVEIKEADNLYCDMSFIKEYMANEDLNIYSFGHSNGGAILLQQGYKYSNIKSIIAINAPLTINFHRIKEGILSYKYKLCMIYGTKDPSYFYIPLIKRYESDKINILIIDGADHDFKGYLKEFIDLPVDNII